jgi:hypothetical protein
MGLLGTTFDMKTVKSLLLKLDLIPFLRTFNSDRIFLLETPKADLRGSRQIAQSSPSLNMFLKPLGSTLLQDFPLLNAQKNAGASPAFC